MQVELAVQLCAQPSASDCCLTRSGAQELQFACPGELRKAGFPVSEGQFAFEHIFENDVSAKQIYDSMVQEMTQRFFTERQSNVVFTYGQRGTPKRQLLFGGSCGISETISESCGLAQLALHQIFASGDSPDVLCLQAFVLGVNEQVVDLQDPENCQARFSDPSAAPRLLDVSKVRVRSYSAAVEALLKITQNVEDIFRECPGEEGG
eukprot:RCo006076